MRTAKRHIKRAFARGVEFGAARFARLLTRKIPAARWTTLMVNAAGVGDAQSRAIIASAAAKLPPRPSDIFAMFLQGYVLFGRPIDDSEPRDGWFWYRPAKRAIIDRESARVPSRLRRYAKNSGLVFRENVDGEAVLELCQADRSYVWLTDELRDVYLSGISSGLIYTASAYRNDVIVASLFGVKVGSTFCSMSKHHSEDQAGSILMTWLLDKLIDGEWTLIDCGAMKPDFVRYGAFEVGVDELSDRMLAGVLHNSRPEPEAGLELFDVGAEEMPG